MQEEFNAQFRARLRSLDITAIEMAKLLGITGCTVSRWGKPGYGGCPTIWQIYAIAAAAHVNPGWLAFGIEGLQLSRPVADAVVRELTGTT